MISCCCGPSGASGWRWPESSGSMRRRRRKRDRHCRIDREGQGTAPPGSGGGDAYSEAFLAVPRRRRIGEVAQGIMDEGLAGAIVTEAGRPVGVVTRETVVKDVLAKGYTGMEVTAGDVLRAPILTVDVDTDLQEAARLMTRTRIRYLAVTREEKLVGSLSDYHIARLLPDLLK